MPKIILEGISLSPSGKAIAKREYVIKTGSKMSPQESGRLGGLSRSDHKAASSRANGRRGGRRVQVLDKPLETVKHGTLPTGTRVRGVRKSNSRFFVWSKDYYESKFQMFPRDDQKHGEFEAKNPSELRKELRKNGLNPSECRWEKLPDTWHFEFISPSGSRRQASSVERPVLVTV